MSTIEPRMIQLAGRFSNFPAYPLADVPQIKRDLIARGVDVIDLGAGDADLAPPPAAVAALRDAAAQPQMSRYPFQLGLPAFREAVSAWMQKRFDVKLDPYREILPLIGSKEGIAHIAFAYAGPGDVTVFPDPGYLPYLGGTLLAGGEPHPVPLRPENEFLIPFDDIADDIARRTRIVYLNYPNNPTAAIAPLGYLEQAVDFCRRHGAILVYDNAYSEIAFDGYRPPSIFEVDGAIDVAVEFHSFSKTYNMTGWRIGWAAGGAGPIAALARVKSFVDTGQFLPIQAAAAAALETYDEWVPANVAQFRGRRDALVTALNEAGIEATAPAATMYLWVPVPGGESEPFARRALMEQGVVIMPGAALGAGGEGFFRAALTQPAERLREAAQRLATLP
ncbi:MAG TPA: aminotransferase class I/II-fold pyridoxal phosphate-dependent enzyme [Longimicrobiales bacterium]|nr:aminotransferase class I/II-fold pyridoxal phosphate-dependent enzyme [Longimicrobiales bacterium]